MGQDLTGKLISAFPETAPVWRSPVWDFLDDALSENSCKNRLYEVFGVSRTATPIDELLTRIVAKGLPALGEDLTEISRLVLALRVARNAKLTAMALALAEQLAKGLLFLSGCAYRRAAAEQIWKYCNRTWVKGLKSKSQGIYFEDNTWDFMARHATGVLLHVQMLAFSSPEAAVLSFPFVEELLDDVVNCVTTRDADRASFIMGRLYSLAAFDQTARATPDLEKLSIWQPFAI